MKALPSELYDAARSRELDRVAMEAGGIDGRVLMERAGAAAFAALRARWPAARRIAVLCGAGNNGGDGYVLARLARQAGIAAEVVAPLDPDTPDARAMRELFGGSVHRHPDSRLIGDCDVVVDALFGTGLRRAPDEPWRTLIDDVARAQLPVLAVDIPSGLQADTGHVPGSALPAQATITFIGLKLGLFTGRGAEFAGEVRYDDLGVAAELRARVAPVARRLRGAELLAGLPRRPRDSHKGAAGHVLVVGGDLGYAGAPRMCGEAAYRAGAGLVSVATRTSHAGYLQVARPELMVRGCESSSTIGVLLARANVLAIGPGLGQYPWGRELWTALRATPLPAVVDADALNLLGGSAQHRDDWILTPHPGEAARLLAISTAEVQADRPAAARAIVERYGGVCVLKGSGTLIAAADVELAVCDRGNPGMASGGMGDVLTGVIAGLLAQGMQPHAAACLGVWAHASAGDRAARAGGERGLLATDLLPELRHVLNGR